MADSLFGDVPTSDTTDTPKDPFVDILQNPDIDWNTRKVARQAQTMRQTLLDAGLDPGISEPRESLFMQGLNALQKPMQAVEGFLDAAFVRGDIGQPDVGLGIERGMKERITGADMLRRAGMENPIARGLLGFGMDVALDPVNALLFGAGPVARAGGRALSETGAAVKDALQGVHEAKALGNVAIADSMTDDIFRSAASWLEKSKELKKFGESDVAADTIRSAMVPLTDKLSSALNAVSDATSGGVTVGMNNLQDLFVKPQVRIGLNLPFVGHLMGGQEKKVIEVAAEASPELEKLIADRGPIGSLFSGAKDVAADIANKAGEILKPGFVGKAIEVPEPVLGAWNNIKDLANEGITQVAAKVASAVDAVEQVPVIGGAATAAKWGAGLVKDASNLFKQTFMRKTLQGVDLHNLEVDTKGIKASAAINATEDITKNFGEYLWKTVEDGPRVDNPEGRAILNEAGYWLDATGTSVARDVAENKLLSPEQGNQILEVLNKSIKGDISNLNTQALQVLDQFTPQVWEKIDRHFQAGDINQDVYKAIQKTKSYFNELWMQEKSAGLPVSFWEAYLPHRFINQAEEDFKASKISNVANFAKARKYDTLADAFAFGGKVPDMNVASLSLQRTMQSYLKQANQNFINRAMLMKGMPIEAWQKLQEAAALNPTGPEAGLLQARGFRLPKSLSPDEMETAVKALQIKNMVDVGDAQETANRMRDAYFANAREEIKGLKGAEQTAFQFHQDSLEQEAWQRAQELSAKTDHELGKVGELPKDAFAPSALRAELADFQKNAVGGIEYVVPNHVAQAIKENIAGRDFVKDFFAGTEFGKKLLALNDGATNWFKSWATLPWPGYWARNLFGHTFFRFADGGLNAMDPGLIARAYNVLSGRSALQTKGGGFITKDVLEEGLRKHGIKFSLSDLISTVDAAGNLDIQKHLAHTDNGFIKNLFSWNNKKVALTQAQEFMRDTFDHFLRVTHAIHHLERGDTMDDAIRGANEALINYRDLSPIEQSVLRRWYMFYGFLSKATKKTLTSLYTQPGELTTQLKAARAISEFFSDPHATPDPDEYDQRLLRSTTQTEQVAYMIGKDNEGKPLVARGFGLPINHVLQQYSLEAPHNFKVSELMDAAGDSIYRTVQKQFATANPLINAAAQAFTGKNLYFDKPLDAAFLRKVPSFVEVAKKIGAYPYTAIPAHLLDDATIQFLNGVSDGKGHYQVDPGKFFVLTNLIPGMGRFISQADTLSSTEIPAGPNLLRQLTGLNVETQSPDRAYLGTIKDKLANQIARQDAKLRIKNQREADDSED